MHRAQNASRADTGHDSLAATIMMVDDEPTTLDVLEMFLQAEGYSRFVKATDSTQALELLAEHRPDVLLLNLMMPEVGGIEILNALRLDRSLAQTPVIILTSSTDPEKKRTALKLGASDFLAKPVDPSELALRLRNALHARAYRSGSEAQIARPALDETRATPGPQPNATPAPATVGQRGPCDQPPIVSRLAGKSPRLRAIVETFVGRLEQKLAEMEASRDANDFEELARLAHWLKGAAGTVGFDAFTVPAEELKLHAAQRKGDAIEASIGELRGLAARIVVAPEVAPNRSGDSV